MEQPTDKVKSLASEAVKLLDNYKIEHINPTFDGGMMIEFTKHKSCYLLEIFNDGDVVFLIRSNDQRAVWDLTHDNFLEKVKIMTLPTL